MSAALSVSALRVAYGATQLPRVAWYVGHSLALRRLMYEAPGTYHHSLIVGNLAVREVKTTLQNSALGYVWN